MGLLKNIHLKNNNLELLQLAFRHERFTAAITAKYRVSRKTQFGVFANMVFLKPFVPNYPKVFKIIQVKSVTNFSRFLLSQNFNLILNDWQNNVNCLMVARASQVQLTDIGWQLFGDFKISQDDLIRYNNKLLSIIKNRITIVHHSDLNNSITNNDYRIKNLFHIPNVNLNYPGYLKIIKNVWESQSRGQILEKQYQTGSYSDNLNHNFINPVFDQATINQLIIKNVDNNLQVPVVKVISRGKFNFYQNSNNKLRFITNHSYANYQSLFDQQIATITKPSFTNNIKNTSTSNITNGSKESVQNRETTNQRLAGVLSILSLNSHRQRSLLNNPNNNKHDDSLIARNHFKLTTSAVDSVNNDRLRSRVIPKESFQQLVFKKNDRTANNGTDGGQTKEPKSKLRSELDYERITDTTITNPIFEQRNQTASELNVIADRVFQIIEKRFRIEKDWRGLR